MHRMWYRYSLNCIFLLLLAAGIVLISSCAKEKPDEDPALKLSFSSDTVLFDTVFTTIGSITRELKIYNRHSSSIRVSSLRLMGGQASPYLLNIDGEPSWQATDLEIDADDSLYVFVKVLINPNDINSPFLVEDSIECVTNGNVQYIKLVAWGQNAIYHTPDTYQTGLPPYSIIDCSEPWTSEKPHVIYGWAVVDSASELIIEAGTRVFFHNKSLLLVYRGASLKVLGEPGQEVYFRNDRLDEFYKDLPGQWEGIWLSRGSYGNLIRNAVIQNGNLGIQVDETETPGQPQLTLLNTRIGNMKTGGLSGNATEISSVNCVIENCGSYAVALNGGNYSFSHLTIGNFWSVSTRQTPSLVMKNYFLDSGGNIVYVDPTQMTFLNSVIWGNANEEILIDGEGQGTPFQWSFDRCYVRTLRNTSDPLHFADCVVNEDPQFLDPSKPILEPDTLSPLLMSGKFSGVDTDILGRMRNLQTPAIGAYEPVYPPVFRIRSLYKP